MSRFFVRASRLHLQAAAIFGLDDLLAAFLLLALIVEGVQESGAEGSEGGRNVMRHAWFYPRALHTMRRTT